MRFVHDTQSVAATASGGLRVIATGLPRCATSSLQAALENELGFGPCMHMAYVAPHVHKLKLCHDALLETNKVVRQKMLHQIFDGYSATTDYPGCAFVEDLMEMYPDAKIICNGRDSAQAWLRSITATLKFFSSKTYLWLTYPISSNYWLYHSQQAFRQAWIRKTGIGGTADGIFVIESYEASRQLAHAAAAKNGKEVLDWKPKDGWAPLCKFLDRPVPDTKFPHLNDEADIRVLKAFYVARGLAAWAAILSSPALAWWAWSRFTWAVGLS